MPVILYTDPTKPVNAVDPKSLYSSVVDNNISADHWLGRANLFSVPSGRGPGTGAVLLRQRELEILDGNEPVTLTMIGPAANVPPVVLAGLTITAATCVFPSSSDNPANVYLVELADRRFHWARIPVNRAYNLMAADGSGLLDASLNSGSPWTWQEALDDLAASFAGSSVALPYTPDGAPENLTYWGGSAWDAWNDILDRLACRAVYDPRTNTLEIVQLGATAPASDPTAVSLSAQGLRTWDDYPRQPTRAWRPEYVRVLFRRFPAPTDGSSPFYPVDTALSVTSTTGVVAGTYVTLYDDLSALGDIGTPDNDSALVARAAERAAAWEQRTRPDRALFHRIYRDPRNPALDLLGTIADRAIVEDRGLGPRTEAGNVVGQALENWRPGMPLDYADDDAGGGTGSGEDPCCEGDPPDEGSCDESPDVCAVWYSNIQHLEEVAVREGQGLRPGQKIGWIGRYSTGSHIHFSLGDGPPLLSLNPPQVIGQSFDIAPWLGYTQSGTRYPNTFPLRALNLTTEQLTYIESVFASPLEGPDWQIYYGSQEHNGGEYYAVDMFPSDVDPNANPPSQAMAGTPVYNPIADGADVISDVVAVTYINNQVHTMVTIRHRRKCCTVDGGEDGGGGGTGTGTGGSGTGSGEEPCTGPGCTDNPPPGPDAWPPGPTTVQVATGDMCAIVATDSGSGPTAGMPDAVSEAIANWVIGQVANGSWDGTPFPLGFITQTKKISLPNGSTIEPGECKTLAENCDTACDHSADCSEDCVTLEDCEALEGETAPRRWQFYLEDGQEGGLVTLNYYLACEWTGNFSTALLSNCLAILGYDGDAESWYLSLIGTNIDGELVATLYYPEEVDGWPAFTSIDDGGGMVAAPDGAAEFPESLIITPACTGCGGTGSGSGSGEPTPSELPCSVLTTSDTVYLKSFSSSCGKYQTGIIGQPMTWDAGYGAWYAEIPNTTYGTTESINLYCSSDIWTSYFQFVTNCVASSDTATSNPDRLMTTYDLGGGHYRWSCKGVMINTLACGTCVGSLSEWVIENFP